MQRASRVARREAVRPVWCRAFQRDLWQGKYSLSCASRFVWKSGSRQAASECCRLGVQCVFFHDLHDCCALCNLRCSFLLAQHQLFIILDDIDDSSSLGPGLRTAEMLPQQRSNGTLRTYQTARARFCLLDHTNGNNAVVQAL